MYAWLISAKPIYCLVSDNPYIYVYVGIVRVF